MKFLSGLFKRERASPHAHSVDPARVINQALSAAGLRPGDGHAGRARSTIDRALTDAGLSAGPAVAPAVVRRSPGTGSSSRPLPAAASGTAAGRFLHASYANAHGRRDYRLYIPGGHDGTRPLPLVVMLHGCTQSAEDFAVGTGMNALADQHGFLVAYPQQVARENHARCWNWFRPEDQRHGAGEPSILAGIAAQVATDHRVDPDRIFAAGLSAGAAMAVVLAHAYPTLFRAIGVHSGLPYAQAHDVPSAFAAMQGRSSGRTSAPDASAVRMIIFHGDKDRTVAPVNADLLVHGAAGARAVAVTESGRAPGGHGFTREVYLDANGLPHVENWTIHGSGHAWSGGSANGSYTDPAGPDASAAMVRFFLQGDTAGTPG